MRFLSHFSSIAAAALLQSWFAVISARLASAQPMRHLLLRFSLFHGLINPCSIWLVFISHLARFVHEVFVLPQAGAVSCAALKLLQLSPVTALHAQTAGSRTEPWKGSL